MPNGNFPPVPPGREPEQRNNITRNIIIAIIVFLAIAGVFTLFNDPLATNAEEVSLSNVVDRINEEQVERLEVEKNKLFVKIKDQEQILTTLKEPEISISESLLNAGASPEKLEKVDIVIQDTSSSDFFIGTILPFLLPVLLFIGLIWFMVRSVQGGSN